MGITHVYRAVTTLWHDSMARASISISLPTDMLADLDDLVDDGEYDDRSEAIEESINNHLLTSSDDE